MKELYPIFLKPTIKNYVWGGTKFRDLIQSSSDPNQPIAEIWIVYDQNTVLNGPFAGLTLQELTQKFGSQLLGTRFTIANPEKFPLLIKLLDCNQWLSIQVHPDDIKAKRIEGPEFNGKTEGWFVIDANPDAQLIAGVKPGVTKDHLSESIKNGKVINFLVKHDIQKDDFIYIPAGTIHALGPGSIIYEIQQNSDITYRVYDWDRPTSDGRPLHIEKSIQVSDPSLQTSLKKINQSDSQNVFSNEYFSLDFFQSDHHEITLDTEGETFHSLTIIEGTAHFESKSDRFELNQFESVLLPASYSNYKLNGDYKLLVGSLNKK